MYLTIQIPKISVRKMSLRYSPSLVSKDLEFRAMYNNSWFIDQIPSTDTVVPYL